MLSNTSLCEQLLYLLCAYLSVVKIGVVEWQYRTIQPTINWWTSIFKVLQRY